MAAIILSYAGASAAIDPMTEVKSTINQVLSVVTKSDYARGTAEKRQKLREIIAPHFDFAAMARSAMGPHWRELTPQQRERYVRLFTALLEASYMGKIESYNGQKIDFVKETRNGPDDAQVNTRISKSGNEPVTVNYRMRQANGTWKVYDVTVDQISLTGNYRNQFNRIMNERGYNALMDAIRQKVVSIDATRGH